MQTDALAGTYWNVCVSIIIHACVKVNKTKIRLCKLNMLNCTV